jgi:hypothetical protein
VQSRWQIKIDADVRIQEVEPEEVPIYAVNVYDPVESLEAPLYVIDIRRDTGAVDVFGTIASHTRSRQQGLILFSLGQPCGWKSAAGCARPVFFLKRKSSLDIPINSSNVAKNVLP